MRSLWKGAISFGLVHIPCRLYPATWDRDPHFRQLHAPCRAPIEYHKVCSACGRRVPAAEIVRGSEVESGRFVVIDEQDLADLPVPTTHTVDIQGFVELAAVDPLYFEQPYLIGPAEGGGRPYALLRAVLRRTGRAAVAKVAVRAKESLALLRVVEDCLVLELMRYRDELRDWREVDGLPGELPLPERELEVATVLVERLSGPWEPEAYSDAYRAALADLLARKVAGGQVSAPPTAAPETARYADLLAALEASVAATEAQRAGPDGARPQ